MLKKLKQAILRTTKSVGLLSLVGKSRWRQRKLLILAYHGVAIDDEHLWDGSLFVTKDVLWRRFQILKESKAHVLSLGEGIKRLYEGTLPERAVCITFDDGNFDFYKQAFPLVKEFGFPVTSYITTYYSKYNKPVFEPACSYILWKSASAILDLDSLVGISQKIPLHSPDERQKAYQIIAKYCEKEKLSGSQKNDLLKNLAEQLHFDFEQFCQKRLIHIMKPEEIVEIIASGVDVQLHTHRHQTPLDESLFKKEIEDNNAFLYSTNQKVYEHFCYPSGNYNEKFFPWLKDLNILSATTCEVELANHHNNILLLPRLVDSSYLSPIEFEGWVHGISSFLPQRKR